MAGGSGRSRGLLGLRTWGLEIHALGEEGSILQPSLVTRLGLLGLPGVPLSDLLGAE